MNEPQVSSLELTVEYIKARFFANRKAIFWTIFGLGIFWLMFRVREVSALLILSYVIALLLDPFITRMEVKGVARTTSIACLFGIAFVAFLAILGFGLPALLNESSELAASFPAYLKTLTQTVNNSLSRWPAVQKFLNPSKLWNDVNQYWSSVGSEQYASFSSTFEATILSGYTLTLALLNLILLPFFVFYITVDLEKFHSFFGSFLSVSTRRQISEVGQEILEHIHVFFKGQATVACILILFYIFGLLLIGLPSAVIVGFISGALSIIPYLGVATGFTISIIIMLVTNPGWVPILKVVGVYAVVQSIEGTLITPKIIGERLGIHPLGVMLALIVGGKLLGIMGVVIAIPAAAAFRVVVRRVLKSLERSKSSKQQLGNEIVIEA